MHRLSFSLASTILLSLAFVTSVHAEAVAKLTIEQLSSSDLGTWTLNASDGVVRTSKDVFVTDPKKYSFGVIKAGQNILSITPPAGATIQVQVFRKGTLVATAGQQYTFPLYQDDEYRFVIQYIFNKLGTLGVTSAPVGVPFKLEGPDSKQYSAITPHTFYNLPVGRYTVRPSIVQGCYLPAPKSVLLVSDKRVVSNFSVTCAQKEDTTIDTSRPTKRAIINAALLRDAHRAATH